MNAKLAAGITQDECDSLNPFVHHLELETTSEKIKTALLTILLLPIRVFLICVLLTTAWLLACVGLCGISEDDLRKRPITGWRRTLAKILERIGQATYRVGGMHVVFKGRQATREEAPILVLAPHSTFLDGGILYYTGFPSIIVRWESSSNPYVTKLINFTQPVFVWRDDPDSRQNTIKEIISRATSKEDWPQILIFPEGTCTNRSCLITFKPGAFYPGVPIQPVCIRYPNKLDTVTWTWEGPSALKLMWLTLTQVNSYCEIEFLPVYTPSEEEKRDPKLFANNVRAVMAKALGVPVVDYTYDDCKLMCRARKMNLPNANSLVDVQKLRRKLGLDQIDMEEKLIENGLSCRNCNRITFIEFANYLNVPMNDPSVDLLYRLYDKSGTGLIDFREYLIGVIGTSKNMKRLEVIRLSFKIYDSSGRGNLTIDDFTAVLTQTLGLPEYEAQEIYKQADKENFGYVTYEKFFNYAKKKAEFASLFSLSQQELSKQNWEICPSETEESDLTTKKKE